MAFWSLSPYDLRALLSLQRGRSVLCLGEAHDPRGNPLHSGM